MIWKRLYKESEGEAKTLPVEVSMRELKLIQNYLTKGKPLNDPSNKECQELVIRILKGLVENADIEKLDIYVSNVLHEKYHNDYLDQLILVCADDIERRAGVNRKDRKEMLMKLVERLVRC